MTKELDQLSVEWKRVNDSLKLAHDRLDIVEKQIKKIVEILGDQVEFKNPAAGKIRRV